eukprot:403341465
MESNKSNKPLSINVDMIQFGQPELVTDEIQTDLPYDKIIDNQPVIDLSHAKENKVIYILSQQRKQQIEKAKKIIKSKHIPIPHDFDFSEDKSVLKEINTLGFGALGEKFFWKRVPNNLPFNTVKVLDQNTGNNVQDKVQNITMITYNIWFESFYRKERYAVILKILEKSKADFVCLQEVIYDFQVMLFNEKWVRERYFVSEMDITGGYGVLILSKWPCRFYEMAFPGRMGRSLLLAECQINDQPVIVATSHFESLNNQEIRKQQLEIAQPLVSLVDNGFLMGDFNFDSSWRSEQANIDKEFEDIYLTLNQGVESFTMPKTPEFPQWRPDKILVKKSSKWKPKSIDIIGRFSIPSFKLEDPLQIQVDQKVRTPSDHYALFTVFEFQTQ